MTLPDGWKRGCLGDLCSIEIGGTPSRGVAAYWDSARDTSNVWVSIRDMRQRFITESAEQISGLGVKKSNVKLQQPGTVLLSFKLSIGRVAIAAVPLFTNEAIAGLSPTGLTRDFLFQGLQGWDLLQGVDQAIKGATLNKQKLKRILFEYPESEREQAKIAEVLSTVDRAIEQTEALIAKQQRVKTGLMQDLLTRGIDEHGNLRSERTHEFKDSPLGRVPLEWSAAMLRDLATINYGRDPSAILDDAGEYPVYGTSGSERHGTGYLYDGESIILGRKGSIDRVHFAEGRFWTIDTAYFLSDFKGSVPKWLYYFLCSIDLRTLNEATGVPSLPRDLLYNISMPTPPSGEQAKIAEVLSTVDRAIEQTNSLITKKQRIKTGLMQDLLTGNRRVTALLEQRVGVTA